MAIVELVRSLGTYSLILAVSGQGELAFVFFKGILWRIPAERILLDIVAPRNCSFIIIYHLSLNGGLWPPGVREEGPHVNEGRE